jgi:tRNA dimethylallyltransferase
MPETSHKTIVVLGPTASGKTGLGLFLARRFQGEIVCADSRQVYRGLDLGTGKDLDDYTRELPTVRHHLIDIADPSEEYHLFRFVNDARMAIDDIVSRHLLPIIVGGTPLYLNALLDGYHLDGAAPDPGLRQQLESLDTPSLLTLLKEESAGYYERVDKENRRRIIRAIEIVRTSGPIPPAPALRPDALLLAPYFDRKIIHARIKKRLDDRLAAGMIDEVKTLHEQQLVSWERLDWFGLEYRFIAKHLQGQLSYQEMREQLFISICQFCKRQDIWFRKMEREGKTIHWLPDGDRELASQLVQLHLQGKAQPPPKIQLKDIFYGPKTS